MNTEARKKQIVQATLETIGEYGIQGATISRIAQRAGVTPPALYAHFHNRRAILVAALDAVYEQITESFQVSSSDDPITTFREICERHRQKVLSQDKTSHAHLFLEFVASAPEEGLREVLRRKESETQAHLVSIVRRFQEQGHLPQDVDADMVASLVAAWAWTGDVANMMDATSIWHARTSSHLMQSILTVLSPESAERASEPDGSPSRGRPVAGSQPDNAAPPAVASDYDGLPEGAVFTVEETAGILKVSPDTVRELLDRGVIGSLSMGTETRIPRRTLVALLRGMNDRQFEEFLDKQSAQAAQS